MGLTSEDNTGLIGLDSTVVVFVSRVLACSSERCLVIWGEKAEDWIEP
jgi:hypothetical protein